MESASNQTRSQICSLPLSHVHTGIQSARYVRNSPVVSIRIRRIARASWCSSKMLFLQKTEHGEFQCACFVLFRGRQIPPLTGIRRFVERAARDLEPLSRHGSHLPSVNHELFPFRPYVRVEDRVKDRERRRGSSRFTAMVAHQAQPPPKRNYLFIDPFSLFRRADNLRIIRLTRYDKIVSSLFSQLRKYIFFF